MDLYPFIALDESKFAVSDRTYWMRPYFALTLLRFYFIFYCITAKQWGDRKNREAFLRNFAAARGFDPLVASNWYTTSASDFATQVPLLIEH